MNALVCLITLLFAPAGAAIPPGLLHVTASVEPAHGLPAVAPLIRAVITNAGSQPVTVSNARLCIETATSKQPCDVMPFEAWESNQLDALSAPDHYALAAQSSVTLFGTRVAAFEAPPLWAPGAYSLRIRLAEGDVLSDPFTYVVDEPTGENAIVWKGVLAIPRRAMPTQGDELDPPLYMDERLYSLFQSHPKSDYGKVWKIFQDSFVPANVDVRSKRYSDYLASGLPPAYDLWIRAGVPGAMLAKAKELASRGQLDAAEWQAKAARDAAEQLRKSESPYCRDAAEELLKTGLFTRGQLETYYHRMHDTHAEPVNPHVDCVALNPDNTVTAWFGYFNHNPGPVDIPIGTRNDLIPHQSTPPQPTRFLEGRQSKVFSVTVPLGQTATWTIVQEHATASAGDRDAKPCGKGDDDNQGDDD